MLKDEEDEMDVNSATILSLGLLCPVQYPQPRVAAEPLRCGGSRFPCLLSVKYTLSFKDLVRKS